MATTTQTIVVGLLEPQRDRNSQGRKEDERTMGHHKDLLL